jgi:tripartite-type tricarboxylate transporter receptor subunit TctC
MQSRRRFAGLCAVGATLPLTALQALAQELSAVKIIVGFPAGGATDTTGRRIGERLAGTSYSRNAALVESKAGAGGRIACETVKAAPPDGSTLLLTPYSCMVLYPHTFKRLSYDPMNDFAPVSIATAVSLGFAVGPMVPETVRTLKDFLARARANPKSASFGSPGAGATTHFIGNLIGIESGVPLQHVPYRGSVPAITELVAGQIAATFTPLGDALANHKAGKVRLIVTTGANRSHFAPEVPTLAESGFAELTTEEWFGFYAPAGTPPTVRRQA